MGSKPNSFLGRFGRALGEGVRNFREELTDGKDDDEKTPSDPKPPGSVGSQLGTAARKGRESLGLDHLQSEVRSLRSELGDLKASVDRERDGLRDSLKGQQDGGEEPGGTEGTGVAEGTPSAGRTPNADRTPNAEPTPNNKPAGGGDPRPAGP